MKVNQRVYSWTKVKDKNQWYIKLDDDVPSADQENRSIFLLAEGVKAVYPISTVFNRTVTIFHEGHDYSIRDGLVITNSSVWAKQRVLIEWGDDVELKCSQGHKVKQDFHFCPDCGEKLPLWCEFEGNNNV